MNPQSMESSKSPLHRSYPPIWSPFLKPLSVKTPHPASFIRDFAITRLQPSGIRLLLAPAEHVGLSGSAQLLTFAVTRERIAAANRRHPCILHSQWLWTFCNLQPVQYEPTVKQSLSRVYFFHFSALIGPRLAT